MLRKYLPKSLNIELFGNRELYGKEAWTNDPDWAMFNNSWTSIYQETQHSGSFFPLPNRAGYKILNRINMTGKNVAELGPGGGHHLQSLKSNPSSYTAIDIIPDYFIQLREFFANKKIECNCIVVNSSIPKIPLEDASQDVFLSFYSLEHLHPLEEWLKEIFRILKPGGLLVGGIPAEGGLLWGLGRWLTSRRILKNQYGLDMKKIICWSHPNSCDEILKAFQKWGCLDHFSTWPIPKFPLDLSLILKFIIRKTSV